MTAPSNDANQPNSAPAYLADLMTLGSDDTLPSNGSDSTPSADLAGSEVSAFSFSHDGLVPRITGYQITGKLGVGGMGVVWRATQLSTNRPVALKLMSAAALGSDRARLRFRREIDLTARLEHPHIARVYDGGEDQDVCYYAMELADGVPLDQYVKEQKLTRRQIVELMRTVCRAVQFAHLKGVIHRDLKPSNIMVTADGQPKVLDFGLAKAISSGEEGDGVSIDGEVAGTPAYMSPEQAGGKSAMMDTRSDVYTLGVILYRLLVGTYPHDQTGSAIDIIRRIIEQEPKRLRSVDRTIDPELEAVLSKALAREPDQRYSTAAGLAEDLYRYLAGEPLDARPPTLGYLLRKRVRRHRVPLAVAAAVLAGLAGLAAWSYVRVTTERNVAVAATAEKERQRGEAERQRAEAVEQRAQADAERDNAAAVLDFLTRHVLSSATTDKIPDVKVRDVIVKVMIEPAAAEAAKEFAGKPLVEASVRDAIGQTFESIGRAGLAMPHFKAALDHRERLLGPDHPKTLESLRRYGWVFHRMDRYAESLRVFNELVDRLTRLRGRDHPETSDALYHVAIILKDSGRADEAEPRLKEVLERRRRDLGPDDPSTLHALVNYASVLWGLGQEAKAEPLYREAMEAYQRSFGPDYEGTILLMQNYGFLLTELDRPVEAERFILEALEGRQRVFGPNNGHTLWLEDRYARWLERVGRVADAERVVAEMVKGHRLNDTGPRNRHALRALNSQALLLLQLGRLDDAAARSGEAVAMVAGPNGIGVGDSEGKKFAETHAVILTARGETGKAAAVRKQFRLEDPTTRPSTLPTTTPATGSTS